MSGPMADGEGRVLTLEDLAEALDKQERTPSNVPKVDTFHFNGERVSDWLDLVEQTLVGLPDEVKFNRILKYVLHVHHQEVEKVVNAANGSWARFKDGMRRKYRLGDGLLTTTDLEAMNRDDFTTVGAFLQEFKKKARKVHGISEEAQCAIFLGLLTAAEAAELTSHGGGSEKLTWATIDKGMADGSLHEVEQHQMRLQRRKRKERDATASGTPGVRRIVTEVLVEFGYGKDTVVQRKVVTAVQGKGEVPLIEEDVQEEWEEEEPVPQHLSKALRKQRNLAQGGQGSGKGQEPQAVVVASPSASVPSSSAGPSQAAVPPFGQWPWPIFNTFVPWGSPAPSGQMIPYAGPQTIHKVAWQEEETRVRVTKGMEGEVVEEGAAKTAEAEEEGAGITRATKAKRIKEVKGYGRARFDRRTAICQHCDKQGHTIRFCNTRREDERVGLIYSNMDGDIYHRLGEHIDRKVPGGVRAEALRRVATRQASPATFRLWQERDDPPIGVEEVDGKEEVIQRLQSGVIKEEPIVIKSDDESEGEMVEPASVLLGKMEDLWDKMDRYRQNLIDMCEEVESWRDGIPKVFLYDSGPESMPGRQGYPGVTTVSSGPRSEMTHRPPTSLARAALAARTRGQAKARAGQDSPQREPQPERRKEHVEVEDDDDEEDEKLRQEEDWRAEQRARKRGSQEEAEPVLRDVAPKKKKYAVRLEEGFDVERVIDRLLEGHTYLMTLKEILASAPRLRNELKGRLPRRLVPSVHRSVILPKQVEWADPGTKMDWKCVACGMVDLVVKGSKCVAMVDTRAEMNIIREADAIKYGVDIDRSDCGILHKANCKAVFCGTASNVLLEIGRVKARTCFFVMPDVDHDILLGRSFLCWTDTLMYNKHDGSLILILCDPTCQNYEVITCRNTGPRSLRNRPNPGSFTIEESENEHRRLMAKPEEEVREEAFSLSLSDVNKAMDIMATHEMADPDAPPTHSRCPHRAPISCQWGSKG
ncbi:hypothetical protein CBR_g52204 [Chara braunii]|uniref:Peptidase A2 domain-containing protein n=1 Tax=Chara braunii TaxID=69332 RepID=A0A388M9R8_CHABU|nr:hypothetical protein CBR_g52204 [Chara braunii]|eukprot:GBG91318.1 hypothetical protein CBR_g52204 [Chara braunii]